jgi:hypothetical protein
MSTTGRGGSPPRDAAAPTAAAGAPILPSTAAPQAGPADVRARAERVAARDAARQAAAVAVAAAAHLDADSRAAGDEDEPAHGDRDADDDAEASDASDAEEAALLAQLAAVRIARTERAARAAQMLPPGGALPAAFEPATTAGAARAHGPQPKAPYQERYKGEGGAVLDKWISSASVARRFYTGMDDATAVSWLAPALEDAALDWLVAYEAQHGAAPASPQALFAGLRTRFQPVNAEETARRDMDALRQGKDSVNEYTTKFRRLITLLPGETENAQIYQFRRGLVRAIEDRIMQAEPQPASLEATIALATRVEGRWRASHGSGTEGMASMEDAERTFTVAQLNALLDAARGSQTTPLKPATPRYESRRDRGANKSAKTMTMAQHFGLSEEVTRKRFDNGLCMHCGVTGHIRRECADYKDGKPARLN